MPNLSNVIAAKITRWRIAHHRMWLILVYMVAFVAFRLALSAFTRLFPVLSGSIDSTIHHLLPATFYASGLLLTAIAVLMMVMKLRGGAKFTTVLQTPAVMGRKFFVVVAIIMGCAGIAFLDAHLAASAKHATESMDLR